MSVRRKETSIKEANRKKEGLEKAEKRNEELQAQVTDLQLALCDVFELMVTAMGGE